MVARPIWESPANFDTGKGSSGGIVLTDFGLACRSFCWLSFLYLQIQFGHRVNWWNIILVSPNQS